MLYIDQYMYIFTSGCSAVCLFSLVSNCSPKNCTSTIHADIHASMYIYRYLYEIHMFVILMYILI